MPTPPARLNDPSTAWHALTPEQALARCGVDPARGLDSNDVARRQAQYGFNALPEAPARPWWRTFARQLKSPLIYILFVAAVLAVALGHHGDAGVILAVVLVNSLIGSFQEGRAERSRPRQNRLFSRLQGRARPPGAMLGMRRTAPL